MTRRTGISDAKTAAERAVKRAADKVATERMAEEAKNKLLKVILDKVYRPDGTARPRDEVERLFRKKTDAARR